MSHTTAEYDPSIGHMDPADFSTNVKRYTAYVTKGENVDFKMVFPDEIPVDYEIKYKIEVINSDGIVYASDELTANRGTNLFESLATWFDTGDAVKGRIIIPVENGKFVFDIVFVV